MKQTSTTLRFYVQSLFMVIFGLLSAVGMGQDIWNNPITGTTPNSSNPYTTGDVVASNMTVSGIGRGTGITGSNASNCYNASGWTTNTSLNSSDYYTWTLTPSSCYKINFTSFTYTGQSSGTGPTQFVLKSSLDGYNNAIGSANETGTTISLTGGTYQNITSAITFRLYGYNAGGGSGTYRINDFTFSGSVASNNVTPSITITSSDANNSICTGNSVTFSSSITNGGGSPGYQWKLNGTNISGQTNSTYTTSGLSNGDAVTCVLTSSATCASPTSSTSNSITTTVNTTVTPSVTITSSDADNSFCSGTSVTFTANVVNGGSSPSYQWKRNGNNVGSNTSTYTSSSLSNGNTISLVITANNACQTTSSATSNTITNTVGTLVTPGVSITSSDGNNSFCSGTSVTFTATPSNGGTTPSYQWKVDGSDVGSNSTTYTTTGLTNGQTVTVVMTPNNVCQTSSTVTSSGITNTVITTTTPSVTIASNASGNNICLGSSISFTATPTNGGSTPSYQWKRNGSSVGSNSSTYTLNTATNNDQITLTMTSNQSCVTTTTANANTITVGVSASTLSIAPITNCGTANLTLSATSSCGVSGGTVNWYNVPTGGTSLATGSNYTASYSSTTTMYAQQTFTGGETTYGGSSSGTTNRGLQFDLSTDITLNSVKIQSSGSCNVTIQLWNSSTNSPLVINGTTCSSVKTLSSGGNTVNIGWYIPAGTGYRLVVTNITNSRSLTRTTGYAFPKYLNGVGSITGNVDSGGTDRYNFFYSWNYSTARVSGTVTINPGTSPSVSVTSDDDDNLFCPSTNVTFTANPVLYSGSPVYQWQVNGQNVGNNSDVFSSSSLVSDDVVSLQMTANNSCSSTSTVTSNSITNSIAASMTYYLDLDQDGVGITGSDLLTCFPPAGYVLLSGDCDDSNMEVSPYSVEVCNGLDDDCDAIVDNGHTAMTLYEDLDTDGYGSIGSDVISCDLIEGYVEVGGDCDDSNTEVNPASLELCSTNVDDDCDGLINENCGSGNDSPSFPTTLPVSLNVTCSTLSGTLLTATPTTSFGTGPWIAGNDLWYYFTSIGSGISISGTSSVNDLALEMRTVSGDLVKSANNVSGTGTEYLNIGGLTAGQQYKVRVINTNMLSVGGSFTLCSRVLNSSSSIYYTTPSVITSGCQNVTVTSAYGASSYEMSLTPVSGSVLYGSGQQVQMSNFTGLLGEKFNFNTSYTLTCTVTHVLPLGNGSYENVSVSKTFSTPIVVGSHNDLDLASTFVCPVKVGNGWTVRAGEWLCGSVKYQWRFERMLNGSPYLVNGQPVVIEGYGVVGSRDYVVLSSNGFTSGTEWRVQIRPIFPGNVVGSYGTDYQCMQMKGSLMMEEQGDIKEEEHEVYLYPNPSQGGEVVLYRGQGWENEVKGQVKVYDSTGKLVRNEQVVGQGNSMIMLSSEGMSTGLYWVNYEVGSEKGRLSWMVVK